MFPSLANQQNNGSKDWFGTKTSNYVNLMAHIDQGCDRDFGCSQLRQITIISVLNRLNRAQYYMVHSLMESLWGN